MSIKKVIIIFWSIFFSILLLNATNLEVVKSAGNIPINMVPGVTNPIGENESAHSERDSYFSQIGLLNASQVQVNDEDSGIYVGEDSEGNKMFAFYPSVEVPEDSIMGQGDPDQIVNNIAERYSSSSDSFIAEAAKNFVEAVKDLEPSDFKGWSAMGSACSSAGLSRVKFRSPGSLSNTCGNPSYPNTVLCTQSSGGAAFSNIDSSLGYGCAS
ncbi:hypothetical protein [Francisella sp. XLW-1]|uniref:hypothetical protein n=1 Tax=Francisella sp. XLW-1 TaxID=2610887 RepID=UPI00123D5ADE|nr:hypothetical protein [Francisella sp. XLW-1]